MKVRDRKSRLVRLYSSKVSIFLNWGWRIWKD